MQIPIESIFGAFHFFASVFIAYKLSLSRKKNLHNINIRYFLYVFYLLSAVFLFSAISIISVINFQIDFLISAINIIGRGLILLAVMFFTYIPLKILKEEFWKKAVPVAVLVVAVFSNMFALISLFNYPRTPIGEMGNFIIRLHRTDIHTQAGIISIGILSTFCLILAIVKYFKIIGESGDDDYVRRRGYMIVAAGILFGAGILSNYFLSIILPVGGRFTAEILYFLALSVFLFSVLYKKKETPLVSFEK